jgi:hypothetical protein
MTLRTPRLRLDTAAQRQRLAAARRTEDLAGPPARASIGAIEIELRALGSQPTLAASDEYPEAATG